MGHGATAEARGQPGNAKGVDGVWFCHLEGAYEVLFAMPSANGDIEVRMVFDGDGVV